MQEGMYSMADNYKVTYITNDYGELERGSEGVRVHQLGTVGGPELRASHHLSSRRYADPAARLSYFNANVIGYCNLY